MHDALSERVGVVYEEFTPEQLNSIRNEVSEYLNAPVEKENDVITISSVKQIKEAFKEFKRVHQQLAKELAYANEHGASAAATNSAATKTGDNDAASKGANTSSNDGQVGDLEDGNGFGLGNAASTDRPANLDRPSNAQTASDNADTQESKTAATGSPNQQDGDNQANSVPADKNKAYAMFKETVGSDLRDELARLNTITRGESCQRFSPYFERYRLKLHDIRQVIRTKFAR